MRVKDRIGAYGEQVAVEHLKAAGFVIVARNWRCDIGEIDVVAVHRRRRAVPLVEHVRGVL